MGHEQQGLLQQHNLTLGGKLGGINTTALMLNGSNSTNGSMPGALSAQVSSVCAVATAAPCGGARTVHVLLAGHLVSAAWRLNTQHDTFSVYAGYIDVEADEIAPGYAVLLMYIMLVSVCAVTHHSSRHRAHSVCLRLVTAVQVLAPCILDPPLWDCL
jgi:hypothetical protein